MILSTAKQTKLAGVTKGVEYAARHSGRGLARQVLDIALLTFKPGKFRVSDYYALALWRPEKQREMRESYVSLKARVEFVEKISVPALGLQPELIADKLESELFLARAGFPTTRSRAVYATTPPPAGPLHLKNADDVVAFLKEPGILPLFAKPRFGSLGDGAIWIADSTEDGEKVTLSDGRQVETRALAREIHNAYGDGYIFQDVLRDHPRVQAHAGAATSMVRITTVWTEAGPEPFYAIMKLPAKGAMHDNYSFGKRAAAIIDTESGRVSLVRHHADPLGEEISHWANPDEPLLGMTLPDWPDLVETACRAHELFPAHGLLGWDICPTAEGPVIGEVNAQPMYNGFQGAMDEGLLAGRRGELYASALKRKRAAEGGATQ